MEIGAPGQGQFAGHGKDILTKARSVTGRSTPGGFWCAEKATSTAEFALVATSFFLIFLGVMQFGIAMWAQDSLNFATQQAARCWAVGASACSTVALTQSYAASQAGGLNVPTSAFTVTTPACGHKVSASFSYQFVISGFFPYSPTFVSTACIP